MERRPPVNSYKRSLNDAERARVDDYTDWLIGHLESPTRDGDGVIQFQVTGGRDTSAGCVLDAVNCATGETLTVAIRMLANGDIINTHTQTS
tara:strand:+ start:22 stop:297 length:276 start_codon:yes stop_codon:yes gene_type:complete